MIWSNDPVRDAERYLAEQAKQEDRLPKCCCCGEAIRQEEAVYVDGDWYCADCELDAWAEIRKAYLERVEI